MLLLEELENSSAKFSNVPQIDLNEFEYDSPLVDQIDRKNVAVIKMDKLPTLKMNSTTSQSTGGVTSSSINRNISTEDISYLLQNTSQFLNGLRNPRQEIDDTDDPEFADDMKQDQTNDDEGDNVITGLISAFLGGLSKPDGSIDIDAIVGLLGSLSTQNPDGTYDFQGLTDLLRGLFGGDGGSDIGAFVGGLLGAVLKGIANPPGAKGTGIFTGKLFNGLLPALSGPPDNVTTNNVKPNLDVGGFLLGLLKTIFSGSSGSMDQGMGNNKYTFIKTLFSATSSIFAASSKKGDP